MKIIMLGAPGAGKGTQARRISQLLSIPHVSTGDMLREAKARGTKLGKEAARFMKAGELVPDEVMVGIVSDRLGEPDMKNGFILDGFPRTLAQAKALHDMGVEVDVVLNFMVDPDEIIERLTGRLTCESCGFMHHMRFLPPRVAGVCDKCSGKLVQRPDDNEETVRNRLEVYEQQTQPLVDFYRNKGVVRDIDGTGETPDQVFLKVKAILESVEQGESWRKKKGSK